MESISQRCSPDRQWSARSPHSHSHSATLTRAIDQQLLKTAVHKNASPVQSIKARELTGQLLHPTTIKPSDQDNLRNFQLNSRSDFDPGTLKYVTPIKQVAKFAQVQSSSVNNSGKESEVLPKSSATAETHSVFHKSESNNQNRNTDNSRGETHGLDTSSSSTSPRNSVTSGDSDTKPVSHIPGKRKAPEPPPRTPDQVTNGKPGQ